MKINLKKSVEPAATSNAQNLQDFLEYFELTLLCILHPRYNSIPAENCMGDTLSLKISGQSIAYSGPGRSRYGPTDFFRIKQN